MPITYEKVKTSVEKTIADLIKRYHPELVEADVRVAACFAYGPRDAEGNLTGPAITHGGYQAAGLIKRTSLKERAFGNADAQMLLDGDRWDDWTDRRREAIIDHELQHIEVQWERHPDPDHKLAGIPKVDDLHRPKISLRLHDIVAGGFAACAKRYGSDSIDVKHVVDIFDIHGQLLMPFLVDDNGELKTGQVAAGGTA